jgi:hypothetical protein
MINIMSHSYHRIYHSMLTLLAILQKSVDMLRSGSQNDFVRAPLCLFFCFSLHGKLNVI